MWLLSILEPKIMRVSKRALRCLYSITTVIIYHGRTAVAHPQGYIKNVICDEYFHHRNFKYCTYCSHAMSHRTDYTPITKYNCIFHVFICSHALRFNKKNENLAYHCLQSGLIRAEAPLLWYAQRHNLQKSMRMVSCYHLFTSKYAPNYASTAPNQILKTKFYFRPCQSDILTQYNL